MRLVLLLVALTLPLPALAQKALPPGSEGLRHEIFGEVLRLPPAFASAGGTRPDFQRQEGRGYIAEYFPTGQTAQDWDRLTSITANQDTARGANGAQAAQDTVRRLRGLFDDACIGVVDQQALEAPRIPGARATAATWVSCSHVGATGRGEDVVVLVLVSERNVFTVQLATRGAARPQGVPRDPADWAARLAHLARATLCTPRPGEASPYPSCT